MLTTNRLRPETHPWRMFNQLQTDFNRELSDWLKAASGSGRPSVGVWTKRDEAIVALELPGRSAADIDVSVHRNVVTIESKSIASDVPEGANIIRRERASDSLKRQVQLPFELDRERIEATYERGVLILRLFAHESEQPTKIEVKAG